MKIWSKSVEDVASVERVLAVWLVPIVSITLLGAAQALWRRLGKPHAGPGGHAPHGQQQHQHRQAPHEFSLATSQLDTGGTLLAPARSSLASASLQPQGVSGWMHMILVLLAYWLASHAVQAWHRGGSLLDRSWHATFFHVGPMFSSWAVQLVIFVATTYGYQAAVVRGMLPRRWEVPLQAALELASFALPIMFMGTRTDWPLLQVSHARHKSRDSESRSPSRRSMSAHLPSLQTCNHHFTLCITCSLLLQCRSSSFLLQRIAFGMETAVFLFKQHSYITTNRILREEVERGGPGTGYWVHKLHRMGSPTSVSAPTSTVSASYSHSHAQSQSASDITVGTERSGSASARSPARRSPRISESAIDGHAGASVRATTTSDANGGGGTFDMMPATTTATATTTGSAGSTSDGSASSLTQGTSSLGSLRLRRRAHPLQPLAADAIAAAESLDGTEMAPPTGTITDSGAVPLTAAAGPVSASLPRSGGGNGASHSHNGGTISAASGGSAGAGGVLSTFFRWLKNRYMEDTVRAGGHLRAHEQARRAGAAAASAAHVSEALGGDVSSIAGSAAAAVAKTPSGKSSLPGELPSPAAAAAEDVGAALPVSPCTPWPAGGDACSSGGISGEDDAAEETLLRDPDFARAAAATMAKAMPVHYAGARSQGAAEGASRRSATLEVVPEGSRPRGDSNAVPLFKSSAAATATDGHDQHGSTSATAPTSEHRHAAAAAIRRSVSGVIHSVMRGVEVDTKVVAYPSNVCFKDFAYFVLGESLRLQHHDDCQLRKGPLVVLA